MNTQAREGMEPDEDSKCNQITQQIQNCMDTPKHQKTPNGNLKQNRCTAVAVKKK